MCILCTNNATYGWNADAWYREGACRRCAANETVRSAAEEKGQRRFQHARSRGLSSAQFFLAGRVARATAGGARTARRTWTDKTGGPWSPFRTVCKKEQGKYIFLILVVSVRMMLDIYFQCIVHVFEWTFSSGLCMNLIKMSHVVCLRLNDVGMCLDGCSWFVPNSFFFVRLKIMFEWLRRFVSVFGQLTRISVPFVCLKDPVGCFFLFVCVCVCVCPNQMWIVASRDHCAQASGSCPGQNKKH